VRRARKEEKELGKVGLVALVLGLLGMLLGGGVLLVSLLLPALTNGRTSWDEALLGIIPGALLLAVSFVVAVVGLVLTLKGRKQRRLT
jgi:hypothetical protein